SDPAPIDMIETMVSFRPREFWPRRELRPADARRLVGDALEAMIAAAILTSPGEERMRLIDDCLGAISPIFEAQMREYAYHRNREFRKELGPTLLRTAVRAALAESGDFGEGDV